MGLRQLGTFFLFLFLAEPLCPPKEVLETFRAFPRAAVLAQRTKSGLCKEPPLEESGDKPHEETRKATLWPHLALASQNETSWGHPPHHQTRLCVACDHFQKSTPDCGHRCPLRDTGPAPLRADASDWSASAPFPPFVASEIEEMGISAQLTLSRYRTEISPA